MFFQFGYLILEKEGEWLVEDEAAVDCDRITVLQSIPIDNCLPTAIVNTESSLNKFDSQSNSSNG